MRSVRGLRGWLASERRYAGLGLRLGRVADDRRSRALLALLGATVLVKQPTPWRSRSVRLGVRLGPRVFPVQLGERTDLEVLREVALEDQYGQADAIDASVIVDLGAHIGLATLRLLAGKPSARVIAVEADPSLVSRLRQNVAGLPVNVVHAAICGASGERAFWRSSNSSWGNSLDRTLPWQTAVTVPGRSLDDLLDAHGIAEVDLLKLDIEGAEWELLAEGVPLRVRALVGELHARPQGTPRELLEIVAASMDVRVVSADDKRVTFVATRPASVGLRRASG